jgi:hypothetical protein
MEVEKHMHIDGGCLCGYIKYGAKIDPNLAC